MPASAGFFVLIFQPKWLDSALTTYNQARFAPL